MSRKHKHRADNRPPSRRYIARTVQQARDEIIAALFHVTPIEPRMTTGARWVLDPSIELDSDLRIVDGAVRSLAKR